MMNIAKDPLEFGFDPERLKRITTLQQRYIDQGKLPGFITLIARKGEIAFLQTTGYRDIAAKRPYEIDTIVRIYSMTKPITSVALLMLYEQSLFGLHDPVADYLPEFKDTPVYENGALVPQKEPMTIQNLLTHTAGFTYGGAGTELDHPVDQLYHKSKLHDPNRPLAETIKLLAQIPLRYQPGSTWRYSVATDVLGRLVEVVSGQSLDQYFRTNIFEPLEMVDTAFHIDPAKLDRFATLYTVTSENPLAVLDDPKESDYLPPVVGFAGGSGLVSTITDYYKFASLLMNKGELNGVRLLGRKTVERMTMNHLTPDLMPIRYEFSPPFYGLGFGLGVSPMVDISQSGIMGSNGDYGWGGYAETIFWNDPQEELTLINMTQCIPSGFYPFRKQLRTAVYQALVD